MTIDQGWCFQRRTTSRFTLLDNDALVKFDRGLWRTYRMVMAAYFGSAATRVILILLPANTTRLGSGTILENAALRDRDRNLKATLYLLRIASVAAVVDSKSQLQ